MRLRSRQKSIVFFIAFGACLVALAIALNVGWILLNWRQVALLVFGVILFTAIILGIGAEHDLSRQGNTPERTA